MTTTRLEGDFVVLQGNNCDGFAYTRADIETAKKVYQYMSTREYPFIPTGRRKDFSYADKSHNVHVYTAEIWAYDASKGIEKP